MSISNIDQVSSIPNIERIRQTDMPALTKAAHYISALFQDVVYNLTRLYNYLFRNERPMLQEREVNRTPLSANQSTALDSVKNTATTALNFALEHKKEIMIGVGALALGGAYYYLGGTIATVAASKIETVLPVCRLTLNPICHLFEKPILALPTPVEQAVATSFFTVKNLLISGAAMLGAGLLGTLFSKPQPFFKQNDYQTPPDFAVIEAVHNQFDIENPMVQSCGSDALIFLDESLRQHNCATNLDQILDMGANRDYQTREALGIVQNGQVLNNIGLFYDTLRAYNNHVPLRAVSLNDESIDIPIVGNQTDFANYLRNHLDDESAFLIYKGGATYALYKRGNEYYFFDSHGHIQGNQASPAYVIKSTNLNALLNRVPMLTYINRNLNEAYNQVSFYKVSQSR